MDGASLDPNQGASPQADDRQIYLWSIFCVAFGLIYLIVPNDLIADDQPYGLTDDAGVLAICLVAAWYLAPARFRHTLSCDVRFRIRLLRADIGNFSLLEHRYVDGFVVSGKNSGSHWVKYMLSVALARQHGIDPPRFTSGRTADRIVGRASRARSGSTLPQIATSHTIPSGLLALIPLPRLIRQPPIVLLVRRIPDALVSNYRKWEDLYGVDRLSFMQGDPSGRRFIADAWWYMHFFNRWGALAKRQPDRVLVVQYEAILDSPEAWLGHIARHLGLTFSADILRDAVASASKDRMRALQDPDAGETIVPPSTPARPPNSAERRILDDLFDRYLRFDFGYDAVTIEGELAKGSSPFLKKRTKKLLSHSVFPPRTPFWKQRGG